MAGLHAVQGVAVIVLSQNGLFPVTTNYLTVDTIADARSAPTLVPATRNLFDINLAYLVAAFFLYVCNCTLSYCYCLPQEVWKQILTAGINKARWIEVWC
jgi:hypothetical protein